MVDLGHMTAQQLHLSIFLATLQQRKWVNGEALATDGPSFVLCQDLSKRTIQHPTMAPFTMNSDSVHLCGLHWSMYECEGSLHHKERDRACVRTKKKCDQSRRKY